MREDDFTQIVLRPLFIKLGFADVEFSGGTYEEGKDLIAQKPEAFGTYSLFVAQVKRFKSEKSVDNTVQWSNIVYQLRQAKSKEVMCKDGTMRVPTTVAFVTPYRISARAMADQFAHTNLEPITVIDGGRLYDQLLKSCPDIIGSILGLDERFAESASSGMDKLELFDALKVGEPINFDDIYSDLNFFVGRTDTRELICSTIESSGLAPEMSRQRWDEIKALLLEVEPYLGFDVVSSEIQSIETDYQTRLSAYESENNVRALLKLGVTDTAIAQCQQQLADKAADAIKTITEVMTDARDADLDREALSALRDQVVELIRKAKHEPSADLFLVFEAMAKETDLQFSKLVRIRSKVSEMREPVQMLCVRLQERSALASRLVHMPQVKFHLATDQICQHVSQEVLWLRMVVADIASNAVDPTYLRTFLIRVEKLLTAVNKLVRTSAFGQSVFRLKKDALYENRFEISAHLVFDSGMNVAVYGEAGAGKSTTLHMYAQRKAKSKCKETIVLLQLNRMMTEMAASSLNLSDDISNHRFVDALIKCALLLIKADSSDAGYREFAAWARDKPRILFLVDGLDEAATHSSWVLKAVNQLPHAFTNSQVVISSRDCIDEIKSIEFLGITLMPFNPNQLRRFVEGWGTRGKELWRELDNPALIEVARTPLLATIVCSLHDHGVAMPANEPEVYRKYLALLCGEYDAHKRVERTTTSKDVLELVSRTLGFQMHRRNIREAPTEKMLEMVTEALSGKISKSICQRAIKELVTPCNVLRQIRSTGSVGFGHLRFQEYLASEQFIRSREHSPLDYLYSEWWRGTLHLYAYSADIENLMADIFAGDKSFAQSAATLISMIAARPVTEQRRLRVALNNNLALESNGLGYTDYSLDDEDRFVDGFLDEAGFRAARGGYR